MPNTTHPTTLPRTAAGSPEKAARMTRNTACLPHETTRPPRHDAALPPAKVAAGFPRSSAAPNRTVAGAPCEAAAFPLKKAVAATVAAACMVGIVALAWAFGPQAWAFLSDGAAVQSWIRSQGTCAPFAMATLITAQVVAAVLPGEPLELAAGYLFGFWGGTALCMAGSLVGTLAVTALVRQFGLRIVHVFIAPEKLAAVSWLQDTARFEAVLLAVFLVPGTPKDALTYAAGLTLCPWWKIALITTVGRIPSIVSSTLAAAFAAEGNWVVAAAIMVATAVVVGVGALAFALMKKKRSQARKAG